ncbi:hypothetical protein AQUSIP_06640 [Aquicella siphonis]|uniref:Uncharacterized protein n=1 Tax=Aquicella siphonis TaxID=254247 RepID=A0A5E4PEV4_9COXI|nr:hypothetical protein [Aquicella siphonis]VVC75374.1 hypothetical protein AQUSIP_06640 [Aquicella siphonis]
MLLRKVIAKNLEKNLNKKADTESPEASSTNAYVMGKFREKVAADAQINVDESIKADEATKLGVSIGSYDSTYDLFRTEFNRSHDFIYGMSRPRAQYIHKALGGEAMALGGVPTVDMQNRYIVPESGDDAGANLSEVDMKVKEYHDFLNTHANAKYQDLAKYRDRISEGDLRAKAQRMKYITRSCKAKIEETALKGNQIHFILDSGNHAWDMDAVVKKEGKAGTIITAKELRHIYKNKDMPVNGKTLSSHVTFWRNGQKVKAPWEENPELWAGFVRKNKS